MAAQAAASNSNIIKLFGGAMSCELPSESAEGTTTTRLEWRDISDVRQVPDHQECYQSSMGHVLVIEILDYQSSVRNEDAAKYFFEDLVTEDNNNNGSNDNNQFQVTTIPIQGRPRIENALMCSGFGYHNSNNSNITQVELCVFRLPNISTDILVTLSQTVSEAAERKEVVPVSSSSYFQRVVSTLTIHDWGLFG